MTLGLTPLPAIWPWVPGILNVLVIIAAVFLILLILIQRGKGGGLAGAFGGVGGSSAFGSRAGDLFTRITIITAAIWILLIMLMVKVMQPAPDNTRPPPAIVPDDKGESLRLPADRSEPTRLDG